MPEKAETLADAFARRVAERDNPPPPPPLSQEPAAVQARLDAWLRTAHRRRDPRGRQRLTRMLLALMQHPERTTGQLAEAAGLRDRNAARFAVLLGELGLATGHCRSYWRYWRLTPAAEDALLAVVAGPPPAA